MLSIGEIASLAAVTPSALRYYERCELIKEGVKIGGRRHYPASVLHRLSAIKVCQRLGFSLNEIAELLGGNLAQERAWRQAALARRREVERQIVNLQGLVKLIDRALDCDCHALCDCPHMAPGGHIADTCPTAEDDDGSRAFGRWQQHRA